MISIPYIHWFSTKLLVGGDWRFFWPQNLKEILNYSYAWDSSLNTGIGQSNLAQLWLNSYLAFGANFLINFLHIPWNITEKLLFFWPVLLVSFLSMFFLAKEIIRNRYFAILSSVIFLTNTYVLMTLAGGQVGIGLAYSVSPLALLKGLQLINADIKSLKQSFIFSIFLSLLLLFDPRFFLIVIVSISLYYLLSKTIMRNNMSIREVIIIFVIPFVTITLVHAFWILPILLSKITPSQLLSKGSVNASFFSFAFFEDSFAVLHPDWPENIFGKVYFMRSEFLILPLVAYSSLFFVNFKFKTQVEKLYIKIQNLYVLFFGFLGLLGAFLAKGTNPPLGNFYNFMLLHIPGFIVFRDPTKFYLFIALSYSILIPFCLLKFSEKMEGKRYSFRSLNKTSFIVIAVFVLFWILIVRQAFTGQINGTFTNHSIPKEYEDLKNFINNDPQFFRTLWIPQIQRFGFFSNNHPAISANTFFTSSSQSAMVAQLQKKESQVFFKDASVQYIIIPFDSEHEIFLKDQKYDDIQYQNLIRKLSSMSWLKQVDHFGKIAIFQTPAINDHFFVENKNVQSYPVYRQINPTDYTVTVSNALKSDRLIFSESYNKNWALIISKQEILSKPYNNTLNSFSLPRDGTYTFHIFYTPQKWENIGWIISLSSLVFLSLFLLFSTFWKRGEQ